MLSIAQYMAFETEKSSVAEHVRLEGRAAHMVPFLVRRRGLVPHLNFHWSPAPPRGQNYDPIYHNTISRQMSSLLHKQQT